MPSRIGLNIIGRTANVVETLVKVQPVATLVMNNLALAHELTHALPNTIVCFRDWSLGDERHLTITPQRQIDVALSQHNGKPNLWFYTTNEAGLAPNILDWHLKLLNSPSHLRWIGLNPAVGTTPHSAANWAYAESFLRGIAPYRDRFIFGMHEYAGGVPVSGLPNYAGRIQNWDGEVLPAYHCGRFRYLEQFCASKGIPVPRIILTEHGFDDLSDIKTWLSSLQVSAGYKNIRGWKSLTDQWYTWYRAKSWSPQRTLFEAFAWMNDHLYQGSSVEAQLIFCWGSNGDPSWLQFDVSEATEFVQHWQRDAASTTITPVTPPTPEPPPVKPTPPLVTNTIYALNMTGGYINLRDKPTTAGSITGRVYRDDVVIGLEETCVSGSDYWRKVRHIKTNQEGWVSLQWSAKAKAYQVTFVVAPPIPVIPEPPPVKPSPVMVVGLSYTLTMTGGYINLRDKPATSGSIIGRIYRDDVVIGLEEVSNSDYWRKVRHVKTNQEGWISLQWTAKTKSYLVTFVPMLSLTVKAINTSAYRIMVRAKPTLSSARMDVINPNQEFETTQKEMQTEREGRWL